jgi:hypothetical protein
VRGETKGERGKKDRVSKEKKKERVKGESKGE